HRLLQLALRVWPADSRHWGQALVAELDSISGSFAVVAWAGGAIPLLARALGSHFFACLKCSPGSSLAPSSSATAPLPVPRLPRLAIVSLLAATCALIFYLPQGREAASTVRASWNGFKQTFRDRLALQNLATQARSHRDTRTLAFVALAYSQPSQALSYAHEAVALDPGLAWILTGRFDRPDDPVMPPADVRQILDQDPENAFAWLIAADNEAAPRFRAHAVRQSVDSVELASFLNSDP